MTDPAEAGADGARLRYRLLTGIDDEAFCQRVSDALADGYELHGSPCITTRHGEVLVAQAVVLPSAAGSGGGERG
ncbi:MAG TPA: DUF1737 domain-containing protein [Aquihabitans sp.]|nr:DUF1737 domain-containing protein [Aquihabitans sp.]